MHPSGGRTDGRTNLEIALLFLFIVIKFNIHPTAYLTNLKGPPILRLIRKNVTWGHELATT